MFGQPRSRTQGIAGANMEAAVAEMLGVTLFTLFAFNCSEPLVVALAFSAVSYGMKYVSGGHLNPAVSLAGALSGHITWTAGISYIIAQFSGGIVAALTQALLVPGVSLWHKGVGCVGPTEDLSQFQLFGWELVLTMFFVGVFYASSLIRPGHGDAGPLVNGLALFAGTYTAGVMGVGMTAFNPARIVASTVMFNCGWKVIWLYTLAQLGGSLAASFAVLTLYGRGAYYRGGPVPADAQRLPTEEGPASPLLAPGAEGEGAGLGNTRADTFAPMGLPLKHGGVFRHSTVL